MGGNKKVPGANSPEADEKESSEMQSICVSWCVACVLIHMWVYSQAIAIAVCEGRFGELHHSGATFPDDFWGAAQQFLGFCERLSQLFFPLHKLRVTLQKGNTTFKR